MKNKINSRYIAESEDSQSILKNRVKNDRNNFEFPALLSFQWENPERENSK